MELLQLVLELQPEAAERLGMDAGGKELHLKSKDMTALKRKKLRALFHVSGGGSNGNWRDLSSYLLESMRVQADVRQELFELLCKTIKTANDPSEVNSQICLSDICLFRANYLIVWGPYYGSFISLTGLQLNF